MAMPAHHKETRLLASILPVSKLILETGTFPCFEKSSRVGR